MVWGEIYLGRRNLAFGGVEIPSRSRSLLVEFNYQNSLL